MPIQRSPIDVARVRADTPSVTSLIHFNNAGASLSPEPVMRVLLDHLMMEQQIGGYEAARNAEHALADFYDAFAELLNAHPEEIAYVENATRAWDMAFYAIPFKAGDRILTAEAEYASNYIAFLQMQKRVGVEITVIPSNAHGEIDLDALERELRAGRVRLVALTHIPTQGGLVNPAAEVGRLAKQHGALYLLDACQSVGQMPVDVEAIGCDLLSGTGRKFLRGPRGTGFLYVRKSILDRLEPPFLDLHAAEVRPEGGYRMLPDARRFENWESYVAGRIALGAAARYALALGLDAIEARVVELADNLRRRLAADPRIAITDLGRRRSGIVTFTKADETPGAMMERLARARINVSVSRARYASLDLGKRGLDAVLRASVHYFNCEEEFDRFAEVLGLGN